MTPTHHHTLNPWLKLSCWQYLPGAIMPKEIQAEFREHKGKLIRGTLQAKPGDWICRVDRMGIDWTVIPDKEFRSDYRAIENFELKAI